MSTLQQRSKLAGFQRCVRSLLFSDNQLQLFTGVYYAIFSSFVYDVFVGVCACVCSLKKSLTHIFYTLHFELTTHTYEISSGTGPRLAHMSRVQR